MHIKYLVAAAVIALAAGGGCTDPDERLGRMAEQVTHEQSQQNQRVSEAHSAVADGSRRLVEADAQARRDLAQLQDKLREEQAHVGEQRDALERERKTIAQERRQESLLSASVLTLGILLACFAPLILAGISLLGLYRSSTQEEVGDVLVEELVQALAEDTTSAGRLAPSEPSSPRLPAPPEPR